MSANTNPHLPADWDEIGGPAPPRRLTFFQAVYDHPRGHIEPLESRCPSWRMAADVALRFGRETNAAFHTYVSLYLELNDGQAMWLADLDLGGDVTRIRYQAVRDAT